MSSTPERRSEARNTIAEIKELFDGELPCDEATLVKHVYEEGSNNGVVEKCLEGGSRSLPLPDRKVEIEVSPMFAQCFPASAEDTFYQCSTKEQSAAAIMKTSSDDHISGALNIYVVEGTDLLDRVVTELLVASGTPGYVMMARKVARKLHQSFSPPLKQDEDRRIIIVRGLPYALLAASKTSSYRMRCSSVNFSPTGNVRVISAL